LKHDDAMGGANSLGCPRFDRQGGRGGTRLCRTSYAPEQRSAG
jgi:hypothetical protein